MSQCKKFSPNIFHKTKCSNCFRQKEEHSAEALECNRASRSIARSGYLFVAPDWDFSVPLNRTKRWQRRWFVLYDDGELNYSVDEHPDTVPQGSVDMCKVLEVTGAEQVTGHPHSLALTGPDRVTFVKAASREDARWWAELLAVFPRRHKRNATFPGGRASPSLPQLGRSASPQPPRPRSLPVNGANPRRNFETPPLKEERESPPKEAAAAEEVDKSDWLRTRSSSNAIVTPTPPQGVATSIRNDYIISSGSPPTRDKLRCDDKAKVRRDWRCERLRDIATALTDRSPESSLALPAEGLLHLKKGWLWTKLPEDWARKWIVLCVPNLQIYPDQDEQGNPEMTIELNSVTDYREIATDSKYGFEIKYGNNSSLILSAVTQGIRSNWLQALKKAAPISDEITLKDEKDKVLESPVTPSTPRSIMASSDEEYRTASEGVSSVDVVCRRGSADWSDLPPPSSPPLTKFSLNRVKERTRLRQRLPRCQSRQSTLDSTSTDELDCVKEPEEFDDLQKKLIKAEGEVRALEEEIARLKRFQSEAAIREKKAKEMLLANFEKTESELNQRNSQIELKFLKEQRALQRKLSEAEESARTNEEKCSILTRELQTKQRILLNLQDELNSSNEILIKEREENDRLYKKLQELEGKFCVKNKAFKTDSLSELTNINLNIILNELNHKELEDYCIDLKCRFERAVMEIRAVKRALKESEKNYDKIELENYSLKNTIDVINKEHSEEINLLVQRLEHLTQKLNSAERQLKIKSRNEPKDKRRSLSLKGRESFSINKEVEDKVTELEAKILALERSRTKKRYRRERDKSSERSSPIEDKTLRRLRRKSLDSATSSEPMKLLIRLSSLESKVTNVNTSNESLNTTTLKIEDEKKKNNSDVEIEYLLACAKIKVKECLSIVGMLKSHRKTLENALNELNDILHRKECHISTAEVEVIKTSAGGVVKQLQTLLLNKLTHFAEKKRLLQQNGDFTQKNRLQLLAEKISYENILIEQIQEALASDTESICNRLICKESRDCAYLIINLQNKLNGSKNLKLTQKISGIEYLTQVLAKCLCQSSIGLKPYKNFFKTTNSASIELLCEEKKKLDTQLNEYKSTKLCLIAENLVMNNEQFELTREQLRKTALDVTNIELIKNEIDHVMLRAGEIYKSNMENDNEFFFSFFACERAALELWSDAVGDFLFEEIDKNITELSEIYQNYFIQHRQINILGNNNNNNNNSILLHDYSDIIAHKALIDAKIAVLTGAVRECTHNNYYYDDDIVNEKNHLLMLENLQLNQSFEAEFKCMLGKCDKDDNLEEIVGNFEELNGKIKDLLKLIDVPVRDENIEMKSWDDVFRKCDVLSRELDDARNALEKSHTLKRYGLVEERRPVYLGTEYLNQIENLRAAYKSTLATCKERHIEVDIDNLQKLCEKVLVSMEQWHCRTIHELREAHSQEVEVLKNEKEQALAEETQATLAALDAMRKAHIAEVQREVTKFKQEFVRQQRDDIFDLSEKLSVKSLEAAALEEQLGSATRQLANAQQHILTLERNPQLAK